jgi:phage recombination protein Bet
MSQATATRPTIKNDNAIALSGGRLPYHPAIEERFGVDRASWKALVDAIFPNASSTDSVILALSYCRARKLDPFKRNVHIVPIWSKELGRMVDTIWPGIGELRTTAFRTGEYAGRDDADFGPEVTMKLGGKEFTFPQWCKVTVRRVVRGQAVAFCGPKVYWLETYATAKRDTDMPNEMWATRTYGQIEKCAEAAALRAAFPEEIGSDITADEVRTDRGGALVGQVDRPGESRAATLQQRLSGKPHPTDETKTLDTTDAQAPLTDEHGEIIEYETAPAAAGSLGAEKSVGDNRHGRNADPSESLPSGAANPNPAGDTEREPANAATPQPVAAPDDFAPARSGNDILDLAERHGTHFETPDAARKSMADYLRVKMPKPWLKLPIETRRELWNSVVDGSFLKAQAR